MSRLHQKCVIASAGTHGLLALILLTCPAFLTSKSKPSEVTPITFYPSILIDQPFSNPGGSPGRLPPAPTPAPPAPVVPPPPAPRPKPATEPVKEVTPPITAGESLEVTKETTRKKPQVSLTLVTKKANTKATSNDTSVADAQESQERDRRQQALGQFDRSLGNIRSGTGSAVKVEEGYGSGNSGPSYASYAAWVRSFYDSAWVRPEDATTEDATAEVSVTIASDGAVIAKRITKRSGDRASGGPFLRAPRINSALT